VLGIDVGTDAARALGRRNHLQRKRRLARALRPVDLDYAAAGKTANADRRIETKAVCGDSTDVLVRLFAETHDRAFAKFLFDLQEGRFDRFSFIHNLCFGPCFLYLYT
jgi:hypothetical protein